MCFEAENGVVGIHSFAVVRDGDQLFASLPDGDCDSERAGVQGIFQQLLQNRGGTFHNLSRCDFIVDAFCQKLYFAHSVSCGSFCDFERA